MECIRNQYEAIKHTHMCMHMCVFFKSTVIMNVLICFYTIALHNIYFIYIYVYVIYVYIYIYIYIYIYTHTHIHTHIDVSVTVRMIFQTVKKKKVKDGYSFSLCRS